MIVEIILVQATIRHRYRQAIRRGCLFVISRSIFSLAIFPVFSPLYLQTTSLSSVNTMAGFFRITVLFLFLSAACHAQDDQQAVRRCFDNYKAAILEDRGEDAVQYVDSRTIRYYEEILQLTKTADSAAIDTLSLLDKLMVFSIRYRLTREEITTTDGRGLLVHAIHKGMVGKSSVAGNEVGTITVEGAQAKAQLIADDKRTQVYFRFYREEGGWKIDLTALFPLAATAFDHMAQMSGLSDNEFLFDILERLTGTKPGPEIWQPVQ